MPQPDIEKFLQNLNRSRLLGPVTAEELWRKASPNFTPTENAEAFAYWLVEEGKLTKYQADKLLRGHTRFFVDDYKLMDQLGTGRMAGVYRATDKPGMPVAVKILPPSSTKKPDVLARFQREAELALQLNHPCIVKTYYAGASDGLHYIAMEFLEGETLEERLKEKGKLPPSEVMYLADQVLQALRHLQERGMVHRDVKPGNLMLVSPPALGPTKHPYTVKLLDVGLGRAMFSEEDEGKEQEDLTAEGTLIGTPDYMAPEQSRDSHAADIRSDLYSLGCVLYECLSGDVPFPDKNLVSKIVKHASEIPPPLHLSSYSKADRLQAWLFKLLAKKPSDRFQTPAEAIVALLAKPPVPSEKIPVAPPVSATEPPSVPLIQPRTSPHRTSSSPTRTSSWKYPAILAGLFLILVITSYLVLQGLNRTEQQPGDRKDKVVSNNPPPQEEGRIQAGKENKREGSDSAKAAEPDPKDLPKKSEPIPKEALVITPAPKKPQKKDEPESKTNESEPKTNEPEPKIPPKEPVKRVEVKKESSPDKRLPIPSADQIAQAEVMVKNVFKTEYASTKTDDRLKLAAKLQEIAVDTKDHSARYVMLREAREIAVRAGNASAAMLAAEEMANQFQVSFGASAARVGELLMKANLTPTTASEAAEILLTASDTLREEEDWSSAIALAEAAEVVARKGISKSLITLAQTKLREA
jgi:serine/threonine protein kinase